MAHQGVVWHAADVYMIDEPSSYLDVRQRLKAAEVRWDGAVHAAAAVMSGAAVLEGRRSL